MARIEPPRTAAWILEHLIPASERDEAVAGDLEEHFRAGRSDAWYWRQAAGTVATGWAQYLGRRRTLLVFAVLWSMLAPAWYAAISSLETVHRLSDNAWPLAFASWTGLNLAFLWAGLMVYQFVHRFVGRPIPGPEIRRAFWKMPLIFLPVAGVTGVIAVIYQNSVPGLASAKLAANSWEQITDLGILADVIRIPYFAALFVALWGTVHRYERNSGSGLFDTTQDSAAFGQSLRVDQAPWKAGRFLAFVVAAGLINALLFGFLLCRLPHSSSPTLSGLLLRAACYVVLGGCAGAGGAWIYWNNPASPFRDSAPVHFRLFALACAAGWIWTPAFILFYQQVTPLTAFVAAIGACALAAALRRIPLELGAAPAQFADHRPDDLFSAAFLCPQSEGSGMIVALAIYCGGFAVLDHSFMTASLLLGVAAFLVGWRRAVQRREPARRDMLRAARRVAILALPAIFVTAWALLNGVASRNRLALEADVKAAEGSPNAQEKAANSSAVHGSGGYESVILWPSPEKKQVEAPLPDRDLLAPGTTRPLVLRFDGPYWYLQPPDKRPGADAHQAHGSPLGIRIEANNSIPLIMEARQRLDAPIPLARCRQIDIELENRDQQPGVVDVVLLLEDSSMPGHPQLDAGRQIVVTGRPENAGMQSFAFATPLHGPIRRFDSVAVMLLPESGHQHIGPRIALRELRLYSR